MKNILIAVCSFFIVNGSQAFHRMGNSIDIRPGFFMAGASTSFLKSQHVHFNDYSTGKLDWPGTGFSAGIRANGLLGSHTSIGFEMSYLNTKIAFRTEDYMMSIPEFMHYLKSCVTQHQLEFPIYLKWRAGKENKELYAFGGVGLKYIFSNHRKVEWVGYHLNAPEDKTITPITEGSFTYANKKKTRDFILFGVGKNFLIKEKILAIELRYSQDAKTWYYPLTYNGTEQSTAVKIISLSLTAIYSFY